MGWLTNCHDVQFFRDDALARKKCLDRIVRVTHFNGSRTSTNSLNSLSGAYEIFILIKLCLLL
jgi:hypothetical protein